MIQTFRDGTLELCFALYEAYTYSNVSCNLADLPAQLGLMKKWPAGV